MVRNYSAKIRSRIAPTASLADAYSRRRVLVSGAESALASHTNHLRCRLLFVLQIWFVAFG